MSAADGPFPKRHNGRFGASRLGADVSHSSTLAKAVIF
jgi:hypothetical protein